MTILHYTRTNLCMEYLFTGFEIKKEKSFIHSFNRLVGNVNYHTNYANLNLSIQQWNIYSSIITFHWTLNNFKLVKRKDK